MIHEWLFNAFTQWIHKTYNFQTTSIYLTWNYTLLRQAIVQVFKIRYENENIRQVFLFSHYSYRWASFKRRLMKQWPDYYSESFSFSLTAKRPNMLKKMFL